MKKLIECILVAAVLISPIQLHYFASIGHPTSAWLVCDVMGYEEVCE